jgi:hypothetical protein
MRDVAKALSIHQKNVLAIISRCKVMDDSGFAFWSLSIREKKTNGLLALLKKIVLEWWT